MCDSPYCTLTTVIASERGNLLVVDEIAHLHCNERSEVQVSSGKALLAMTCRLFRKMRDDFPPDSLAADRPQAAAIEAVGTRAFYVGFCRLGVES